MNEILLPPAIKLLLSEMVCGQVQYDTTQYKKKDKSNCEQQAPGNLFRKKGKQPPPQKDFNARVLPNVSSKEISNY